MLSKKLAFDSTMPVNLKKTRKLDNETCATINGYYNPQKKSLGFCQIKTEGETIDLYYNAKTLYHELGHAVAFKKYPALAKPAPQKLPDGSEYYRTALNEGIATIVAFWGIEEYLQDYIDRNNLSHGDQKITPLQLYCLENGELLKKYGLSTPFLSSSYKKYFLAMYKEIVKNKGDLNITAEDLWLLLDENVGDNFDSLSRSLQKSANLFDHDYQKKKWQAKNLSELLPSSDQSDKNDKKNSVPVTLDKIEISR